MCQMSVEQEPKLEIQRWEYTWLLLPHNLGEFKTETKETASSRELLATYGDRGWEAFAVVLENPTFSGSRYIFFLKRPILETKDNGETTTEEAVKRAGLPPKI